MSSQEIFEEARSYFGEAGFNLFVKIKSEEYDRVSLGKKSSSDFVRGAKSILLSGFAGKTFWPVFNRFLIDNPDFKEKHEDLIDAYTTLKFSHVSEILGAERGISYKAVFPFGSGALDMDFVNLGMLGGVGVPSLLGILLNPEYGTWVSLRGALITDLEFENYDEPLVAFEPCPACPKPCITACPAHTVSDRGWDWESCMRFRISSETCSGKCASRLACPYGKEHAYTEGQIAYHHGFVLKSVKDYFRKRGDDNL